MSFIRFNATEIYNFMINNEKETLDNEALNVDVEGVSSFVIEICVH